jgi:transposase-like protein
MGDHEKGRPAPAQGHFRATAQAEKAFDLFVRTYEARYPKATDCLVKDRAQLLTFYDFPAEHWMHLRTTNPIESVFATVRLRTEKTKGCGTGDACLTMVFKLMESASKRWRALNKSALLAHVAAGTVFVDGEKKDHAAWTNEQTSSTSIEQYLKPGTGLHR